MSEQKRKVSVKQISDGDSVTVTVTVTVTDTGCGMSAEVQRRMFGFGGGCLILTTVLHRSIKEKNIREMDAVILQKRRDIKELPEQIGQRQRNRF